MRPGSISRAQIAAACGRTLLTPQALQASGAQALRASGTLESHYAPQATVRLMHAKALQQALDLLGPELQGAPGQGPAIAVYARTALRCKAPKVVLRAMPSAPVQAAHDLFADLRALDALGPGLIWVETPPDGLEWEGVRDRLQRASA